MCSACRVRAHTPASRMAAALPSARAALISVEVVRLLAADSRIGDERAASDAEREATIAIVQEAAKDVALRPGAIISLHGTVTDPLKRADSVRTLRVFLRAFALNGERDHTAYTEFKDPVTGRKDNRVVVQYVTRPNMSAPSYFLTEATGANVKVCEQYIDGLGMTHTSVTVELSLMYRRGPRLGERFAVEMRAPVRSRMDVDECKRIVYIVIDDYITRVERARRLSTADETAPELQAQFHLVLPAALVGDRVSRDAAERSAHLGRGLVAILMSQPTLASACDYIKRLRDPSITGFRGGANPVHWVKLDTTRPGGELGSITFRVQHLAFLGTADYTLNDFPLGLLEQRLDPEFLRGTEGCAEQPARRGAIREAFAAAPNPRGRPRTLATRRLPNDIVGIVAGMLGFNLRLSSPTEAAIDHAEYDAWKSRVDAAEREAESARRDRVAQARRAARRPGAPSPVRGLDE